MRQYFLSVSSLTFRSIDVLVKTGFWRWSYWWLCGSKRSHDVGLRVSDRGMTLMV